MIELIEKIESKADFIHFLNIYQKILKKIPMNGKTKRFHHFLNKWQGG